MHRGLKHLIFFVLILSWCSLSAQESFKPVSDVESFKSRLAALAGSTNTISCDFVQEKSLAVLSEKIISKGQFCFKKANNIRWEYTSPYKYLIIISNNQMFTDDNKNKSRYDLESNKMLKEMNGFISGCIQGDILKNDKEYSIKYFENSKLYYVKLVPRSEKMRQMLNEVQIWFDKKDMTVSGIKMVETGEDYTKIDFINKKLNLEIPIEKFNFQ